MTTTAKDLREKRAGIWAKMTEIMDRAAAEKRDLTGEETATYAAAETELDATEELLGRQERHEQRTRDMSAVDRGEIPKNAASRGQAGSTDAAEREQAYLNAFTDWMKYGTENMNAEQRTTLRSGFIDGREIQNAAGVATGGAGGYTVPAAFRNVLVEAMAMVSSVRAQADSLTTATGANIPWPTVDDTGNEGAILAENVQLTEQDVVFGTASLDAYMYTSKLIRVSLQLLNDTGFDLEGWLRRNLATRIARIQNRHFTVGTGTNQPNGIVTAAVVGKVGATGQTTTITYDDLVDMADALDEAYAGGNLQWMMSKAMRKVVRKIKDGQGRPMWEPSLQVGQPDSLLGYGIVLNGHMPTPAANAKSVLFGDFRAGYIVRDVQDFFLIRFAERYADYLQVGFAGFQRSDADQQDAGAYRAYQQSAT